jgi:hypothetical protein
MVGLVVGRNPTAFSTIGSLDAGTAKKRVIIKPKIAVFDFFIIIKSSFSELLSEQASLTNFFINLSPLDIIRDHNFFALSGLPEM